MKYNISDIKKKSTQIKNKEGTLAAVDFIKNFIVSTKIELSELLSLLDKIIPYAIKEKTISEEEILEYVNQRIDKFPVKDDIEKIINIADTLSRINIKYGIEYLVSKIDKDDAPYTKNPMYFDALIQLSDFYLDIKEGDKAFQTIGRAIQVVSNIQDKWEYVRKHITINKKSANICFKGRLIPQYADYLHYYIVHFIFNIARELVDFPHHFRFPSLKKLCLNEGGWDWFENDKNFNEALNELNIYSHKQELLNEIYDFSFNKLPLEMGIPEDCTQIDYSWEKYRDKYYGDMMVEMDKAFKEKPFNEIGLIHEFVTDVAKKYYDMEN